jgi:hypothetical protein
MYYNHKGERCLYRPITCQEDSGCNNCCIKLEPEILTCELCGKAGYDVTRQTYQGEIVIVCNDTDSCLKRKLDRQV